MLDILGNIGFDWRVALANIVNFLVIFFILKKFAFGPIRKMLSEREGKIREGVENATRAQTALTMAGEEHKRIVAGADREANDIIAKASVNGEGIIESAKDRAQTEAESILEKTRVKLDRERKEMERAVNEKIADVVLMGVEKVLREEIDQERGEKIIRNMLKEA